MTTYLTGFGLHFPEERLTNAFFASKVATTEEWLEERIGIQERRRAPDDVDVSDMGVLALQGALADTGWNARELELMVCSTSTPDALVPPTACYIGNKLGIDPVAFDVNAACSGFVYGLSVVEGLIAARGYGKAALISSEKYTKVSNYEDRTSCVFFGDGAAAFLVTGEKPARGLELVDVLMQNVNEGADMVNTPVGGYFRQHGSSVKTYATKWFEKSAKDMLARHDLQASDLKAFMGHQANLRVLEYVCDRVGIGPDQHWHNVRWFGNQGGAGIATTLAGGVLERRDDLKDGDLLLLTVFGSGFTTGSALMRWVDQEQG